MDALKPVYPAIPEFLDAVSMKILPAQLVWRFGLMIKFGGIYDIACDFHKVFDVSKGNALGPICYFSFL